MKQGQSIRALSGKVRVEYDPEWSPSKPYATFIQGTAGPRFGALIYAIDHCVRKIFRRQHSCRWTEWT